MKKALLRRRQRRVLFEAKYAFSLSITSFSVNCLTSCKIMTQETKLHLWLGGPTYFNLRYLFRNNNYTLVEQASNAANRRYSSLTPSLDSFE